MKYFMTIFISIIFSHGFVDICEKAFTSIFPGIIEGYILSGIVSMTITIYLLWGHK